MTFETLQHPTLRKSTTLRIPACLAALAVLLVLAVACGGTAEAPDGAAAEPAATESSTADAPAGDAGEVSYEPAYPEEVSEEGLSEEDTAVQGSAAHDPGDDSHEHGEDSHEHGDEDGHGHEH